MGETGLCLPRTAGAGALLAAQPGAALCGFSNSPEWFFNNELRAGGPWPLPLLKVVHHKVVVVSPVCSSWQLPQNHWAVTR